MAKSINMCVRVDPELKAQAEEILEQLGMTMNGTINMFLTQIVREKRVPLNLSLNSDKDVLPDVIVSKQERENGIDGIDAKILLEQMRKIVSEAESK
jgi:DNA-damage-inducible protein J